MSEGVNERARVYVSDGDARWNDWLLPLGSLAKGKPCCRDGALDSLPPTSPVWGCHTASLGNPCICHHSSDHHSRSPSGLCSQQANPALQNRKATSDGIRDWAQAWHLGVGSSMEAPWHNPSSCRGWQGRAGVHWTEQPFLPARTFPGGRWLPVKLFPACRDGAHMCGYRAETVGRWTHMCPPAFSCLPETQSREVTSQAT